MSSLQWFLLAFIVIAALGYWNWKRTGDQLQQLQATGFVVTDDLGGNPKLVVDSQSKTFAIVTGREFRRYTFSQISSIEYNYDSEPEVDVDFRLEIHLNNAAKQIEKVIYRDEFRAEEQLKKFNEILSFRSRSF